MEPFRVIIAGGRHFDDYELLARTCDRYLSNKSKTADIVVVSGTCSGADLLGERYAMKRGYSIDRYPPDWETFGDAAGPIRNRQMANVADALIAFHDGKSRGTKNMIKEAEKRKLLVRVCLY